MVKQNKTMVYVHSPSGKVIPASQYKKLNKKRQEKYTRMSAWGDWNYSRKEIQLQKIKEIYRK